MAGLKVKVGLIGCGFISAIYLKNARKLEILEVVACADIVPERAKGRAEEYGIPRVCTVEELLADPEIEVVLNLTVPKAHGQVALAAVEAGKSVYNEKPLSLTREDARRILDIATARGLLVGCAPDTFLGGGLQTCRKVIDDGWIGEPVAASAFMAGHGPEGWHPDPEFYYQVGGGPMFDMGPYYLNTLISMMGPVRRVSGSARITYPERTITSQPKHGTKMVVETPTHITGVLDFASGAVATMITSFDVWASLLPRIEVYGSEGTLILPDPNTFRGPVRVWHFTKKEWTEVPLSHGYTENSRGIGLADMAYALRSGRPHRASGQMAYHVLDIMHAFHDSSREGKHVELESTCNRPAPLPLGLIEGTLDA